MRFFLGRVKRDFFSKSAIIAQVSKSNNFDPAEDLEKAEGFIFFDSPPLRSWLVATKLRLYHITDDIRKKSPLIDWSISRSKLYEDGVLVLEVKVREISVCKEGEAGGIVDIGYRPGNRFSPELFLENNLAERVLTLVRERMLS